MDQNFDVVHAVETRRSARSFKMDPLAAKTLTSLVEFSQSMQVPFPHETAFHFFKAQPTTALYFAMKSPPDNVAFLSPTDPVSISKTGFVGELLILFAQSLGVATCWYGHYHRETLEQLLPSLPAAEKTAPKFGYSSGFLQGVHAVCVSPMGYYEESGLRLMDRLTASTVSYRRKSIAELLANPSDLSKLPQSVLFALELARKAPSAANSQMWRFSFEQNYHTLVVAMPIGYKHFKWEHPDVDIGICACHVWLGLKERGLSPCVSLCEEENRAVWRFMF